METLELLTDDQDIRDTKLSMYIGGNGDYYIEMKETKRGEIVKLNTRIAMSGGNATPEVRRAVANLFKALRGEASIEESALPTQPVGNSLPSNEEIRGRAERYAKKFRSVSEEVRGYIADDFEKAALWMRDIAEGKDC